MRNLQMQIGEVRVKDFLLYAGLLVVLAAAALSDRYPQFVWAMVGASIALVAAEFAAVYVISSRAARRKAKREALGAQPAFDYSGAELIVRSASRNLAAATAHDVIAMGRIQSDYASALDAIVRASVASHRDIARYWQQEIEDIGLASSNRRRLPPDLAKWAVAVQGENAFSVKAGSFEIDHFHGRTNIRVLDPSVVTIERTNNGATIATDCDDFLLPLGVDAPTYQ